MKPTKNTSNNEVTQDKNSLADVIENTNVTQDIERKTSARDKTATQELATQVIHATGSSKVNGTAFNQAPVFASAFHLKGEIDSANFQYARFHNPTWEALESAIGQLEGGDCIVFPSGMAAVASVLTALVNSGETILMQSDGYYASRAYAESFLVKFGVNVVAIPTEEISEYDLSKIQLIFIETPSNPLLDVIDIQALAKKSKSVGTILAVDNTTMTPLGQQPLALGADLSICSDTKALNGHSDVLFGHIATNNKDYYQAILTWRKLAGNIPGPMETWLVHRGLATLEMRLERMVSNANILASWLAAHEKVLLIRYPGLANDPSYQLAKKQMHNSGFIISFDLGTQRKAELFLQKLELIIESTSFGGFHTMAERRARWGTDAVSEGLIRLSVGCEGVKDLKSDIAQALDTI